MTVHESGLIWRLLLALVLSSVIGAERESRNKNAGLRTYALVGVGSALFMLISQYGFSHVLGSHVTLDPSRVAAQVVSGIGFIGAGLIFVRRQDVRGLTTAAGVWVTAAIGMAAGGDLPLLAVSATALYLIVSFAFPPLSRLIPTSASAEAQLRITYREGAGLLRQLITSCSEHGFAVADLGVEHAEGQPGEREVTVLLELRGRGSVAELAGELESVDGVREVATKEPTVGRDG
jgi:putative Mg2+ transporter-C (MgtC) family protein